ncbi:MAG TPA: FAD-binding oxidoreductase [Streptosporangiaceae bacterium]|jgi:glycine/D-amino acid oxidase-like deaminating enzyme|nr:FAD-binding oxidoreductase [Streptosporangiaceae bacterium]
MSRPLPAGPAPLRFAAGLPTRADAVVIGAGMVGAATAAWLAGTGRTVCVIDRTGPLGGTTASGEGNILMSDKMPGPELTLALRSARLWREFAASAGPDFEYEPKGGVVVAHDQDQLAGLRELCRRQRAEGIEVTELDTAGLREAEPYLAPGLAGGAFYPQDGQVQPMLAAVAYLGAAPGLTLARADAVSLDQAGTDLRLSTDRGRIVTPVVVNAAGPWAGEVARRLSRELPVRPRRGHILVTEPLPPLVRHKVYECDYVATVRGEGEAGGDDTAVAYSAVVESTASGTVLIGSSRDFGGRLPGARDRSAVPERAVLAQVARRAIALFPVLSGARAIRAYAGFRPASPDHLPIIGPDPAVPGLYHATGHEGAGICLAPGTAELLTALIDGAPPPVDPAPFAPARFALTGGRDGR